MRATPARPSTTLLVAVLALSALATAGCDKLKPTQPPSPQVDPAPAAPGTATSAVRGAPS